MSWGCGSEFFAGAWLSSAYMGLGVLGADVPSTGDDGEPPLHKCLDLPADAGVEFHWQIDSLPAYGVFTPHENGALEADFTGAPDGVYVLGLKYWADGAGPFSFSATFTNGDIPWAASASASAAAAAALTTSIAMAAAGEGAGSSNASLQTSLALSAAAIGAGEAAASLQTSIALAASSTAIAAATADLQLEDGPDPVFTTPPGRTLVVGADGRSDDFRVPMPFDGDASLDFMVDWSAWLAECDDAIASYDLTPSSHLSISSDAREGGRIGFWVQLAGPVRDFTEMTVECSIVTANIPPRRDDRTIRLIKVER